MDDYVKPLIYLDQSVGDIALWQRAFDKHLPEYAWLCEQSPTLDRARDKIEYFCGWQPPEDVLAQFPNLRCILNTGAGLDHLQRRPDIEAALSNGQLEVVRVVDGGMGQQIAQYIGYGALYFGRQMDVAATLQSQSRWDDQAFAIDRPYRVGLLGFGTLARQAVKPLLALGYAVSGWSRQAKSMADVRLHHGEAGLDAFLGEIDLLACLLPGGRDTQHFINAARLSKLKPGAALINCGRGSCIDTQALLEALDFELSGALLDVFETEPLPASHPLWSHPRVRITPHIAARTLAEPAVMQFAEHIRRENRCT